MPVNDVQARVSRTLDSPACAAGSRAAEHGSMTVESFEKVVVLDAGESRHRRVSFAASASRVPTP